MADKWLQGISTPAYRALATQGLHRLIGNLDHRRSYPKVCGGMLVGHDNDTLTESLRVDGETFVALQSELISPTGLLTETEASILALGVSNVSNAPVGDVVAQEVQQVGAGTYKCVICSGQSNSVGMRPSWSFSNWPSEWSAPLANAVSTWWLPGLSISDWTLTRPGIRSDDSTVQGTQTLAIVHRLRETWPRVASIHHAVGGTSLAVNWAANGAHWLRFADWLPRVIASSPVPLEIVGFHWDQGENDSAYEDQAAAYQENLTALISRVRSLVSAQSLDVVIRGMPIDYLGGIPGATIVHNAQLAVASADENVHVVSGDGFYTGGPDAMHCSDQNAQIWGQRVADEFVANVA